MADNHAMQHISKKLGSNSSAILTDMTSRPNMFSENATYLATLVDPNDRGMLDVMGFDMTVPAVIEDFVRK